MTNNKSLLIIIPAYNEAKNIEKTIKEIEDNNIHYDYVIINDGSTDDTRKICINNNYNLIDLPVNTGLSGAIRTGMRYANFHGYDFVLQLDGDGQHDPKYIEKLMDTATSNDVDIVIGSRFVDEKKSFSLRMIGSRMISSAILFTTGKRIFDVTSGMRLFNKKMIKRFGYNIHYSPEPDSLAYLLRSGITIKEVQVEMRERTQGESYLNIFSSIWYMLQMLFSIFIFQWIRKKEV